MIDIERLSGMKKEHEDAIAPYVAGRSKHADAEGQDDTADYIRQHLEAIQRIDQSIHDIKMGRTKSSY